MAQPTPSPSIPLLPFVKDELHFSPQAPITPATPSSVAGTKRKRPASMTPSRPPPGAIIDISSDSDSDRDPTPKAIPRRQVLCDRVEHDDDGFLSISSVSDDEEDEPPSQAKPRIQGISANAMDKADTEPTLCKEQQDVVDLILRGRNVFYTGSAGCGKSTVLKAVVKKLEDMGKIVNIVAPTGKAALQVNGMSTWSYMGWTPNHLKYDLDSLIKEGFRKHIRKRIRDTDVLIIDEISMVENHYLERMNHCITAVRCWNYYENRMERGPPPFGGLQLIVTGDFCQLPPVKPFQSCYLCGGEMLANDDESEFNCDDCHGPFEERDKWAFKSMAWKKANFEHVHLREIHRQKDQAFIQMLQKCRLGIPFSRDETKTLIDHPCKVGGAAQLLCMKHEVNKVNRENFNKLKTPTVNYHAIDEFNWNPQHEHLRSHNKRNTDGTLVACKDHRLEPEVILRVGMLVVLQVNLSISAGLCNGSQGIICGFEDYDPSVLPRAKRKDDMLPPWQVINGEYATLREMQIAKFRATKWPVVKFQNGKTRTIFANCMVNSYGKEPYSLLHRTQIPLLPGWAISVHMSQGMTLNRVIVNLSRAFAEGQVYVALSRATSLEGLKIDGDSEGLAVGNGGNEDVREFLLEKFGKWLFDDHCPDSTSSQGSLDTPVPSSSVVELDD
ncbi:ATP-dependent DNA helicase [Fusarium sp. LHS14.1]|nr:ATP-dependent DNA helicase [Fusarium sp. LHS14.1]